MKKKHIFYSSIILFFCVCAGAVKKSFKLVSGVSATDSSTISTKIDYCTLTNDEDSLDFGTGYNYRNVYMYTELELQTGLNGFESNFQYKSNSEEAYPLANPTVSISISEIARMIDVIKVKTTYSADSCFSAIKIYYGLRNKQMVFVCEPIALTHKPNDPSADNCIPVGSKVFYIANGSGKLELIDPATQNELTKNYEDSVYITHYNSYDENNHDFISSNAYDYEKDDSYYCILPLQQILRMYRDNTSKCTPTDLISFSIIANDYFTRKALFGKGRINNFKVHVVAFTNAINNKAHTSYGAGFQNLGADFGQMCPPNCNTVAIPAYYIRTSKK